MTDVDAPLPEPPPPEPPRPTLVERLGPRAVRRMTPRLGIALAGAGAVIAVGGALGIGGDQLLTDDGDVQRIPGVLVALALVVMGLAVLARVPTGAIATGASTAAAVGIPAALVFATFDVDDFPPFAFAATLLLSTLAWLVAYVLGPARGRALFLTLALIAAPVFVMEQTEEISQAPLAMMQGFAQGFAGGFQGQTFEDEGITFDEDGFPIFPGEDGGTGEASEPLFPEDGGFFGEPTDLPDPSTLGVILLVTGLLYAAASHLLTRAARAGAGTPFAPVGVVSLLLGAAFLAEDLKEVGTGLLLVVLGLLLGTVGVAAGRRFTAWSGAATTGLGVLVLVGEALGDTGGTAAATVYLLVGTAVVLAGHLVGTGLGEPDEEDDAPSFAPGAPRAGRVPGPPPAI